MKRFKEIQRYRVKINNTKTIKAYFLSDFHLSTKNLEISREREKKILKFIESVEKDMTHLFLLGDIFDFWFEYKYLTPKGWVRLLGKLANLADKGVLIYYFYGNHDLWFRDYFQKEIGIIFFKTKTLLEFGDIQILAGHGDEIGHKNYLYFLIKWLYRMPFLKFLFRSLPASFCIKTANSISHYNKIKSSQKDSSLRIKKKDPQILFSKEYLKTKESIDYFVFGHQHHALEIRLSNKSKFINLGDWITYDSYAIFDGKEMKLEYFNPSDSA